MLRLVLWSWCGLFWYMFHEHLKGMYILLFWGGMFYKYQFDSIGKDLVEFFHILASFLYICSVNCWERGFDVPIYNYKFFYCSISFCFTYFTALLFDAYTPRISIFCGGGGGCWPIYHVITLSVSGNFLCSNDYFIWY